MSTRALSDLEAEDDCGGVNPGGTDRSAGRGRQAWPRPGFPFRSFDARSKSTSGVTATATREHSRPAGSRGCWFPRAKGKGDELAPWTRSHQQPGTHPYLVAEALWTANADLDPEVWQILVGTWSNDATHPMLASDEIRGEMTFEWLMAIGF